MINIDKIIEELKSASFNFTLHNEIGMHTFGSRAMLSRERVSSLFNHLKKYIYHRSIYDISNSGFFKYLYTRYFEGVDIYNHSLNWITGYTDVEPGFSIKMSVHDEIAHVFMIFNPALIVAASSKDFVASEYDYTQITPHNFPKWNKFRKLSDEIMTRWNIPDYKLDSVTEARVDCCANIDLGDYIYIPDLLNYLRMVCKRSGYKVWKFKDPEHDAHHLLIYTRNQKLSIYDKCEEQRSKFGRNCGGNILRIEAQFEGCGIYQEFSKFIDLDTLKQHRGSTITDVASAVADYAPLAIYDLLDRVFPDGDFYTRPFGEEIIRNSKLAEKTKDRLIKFVDEFSSCADYSEVVDTIKRYREQNSDSIYYRNLRTLEEYGILPFWLNTNCQYPLIPGIKYIYLSAIRNDSRELAHFLNLLDYREN